MPRVHQCKIYLINKLKLLQLKPKLMPQYKLNWTKLPESKLRSQQLKLKKKKMPELLLKKQNKMNWIESPPKRQQSKLGKTRKLESQQRRL